MKHYLIEFSNRVQPKNALQKEVRKILASKARLVVKQKEVYPFLENLEAEVRQALVDNKRCKKLRITRYEDGDDIFYDVSNPGDSTFCSLRFMLFNHVD